MNIILLIIGLALLARSLNSKTAFVLLMIISVVASYRVAFAHANMILVIIIVAALTVGVMKLDTTILA